MRRRRGRGVLVEGERRPRSMSASGAGFFAAAPAATSSATQERGRLARTTPGSGQRSAATAARFPSRAPSRARARPRPMRCGAPSGSTSQAGRVWGASTWTSAVAPRSRQYQPSGVPIIAAASACTSAAAPALVAGREGDGSLSDEAHGEDHRALDRQHRWVLGGEDGGGAVGVAEPGQLGGQLELGTGGVESVACLQVAVPQDRQTNTDLVDVAEQPGGAQSGLLEVQGHPTTGLISDRVERDQRSFEVTVAPVRNAAEPAQDRLPRLELCAFDAGQGREHPRGIASQVRDGGDADGVDEAGDRRARGRPARRLADGERAAVRRRSPARAPDRASGWPRPRPRGRRGQRNPAAAASNETIASAGASAWRSRPSANRAAGSRRSRWGNRRCQRPKSVPDIRVDRSVAASRMTSRTSSHAPGFGEEVDRLVRSSRAAVHGGGGPQR